MKIENIDIEATIKKAQILVSEDKQLSAATKSMFEIMILIITLLANRLNLNSTNSSKPPSSDPNRKKRPRSKTGKKPGGQKGHVGTTLKKVDDPDKVELIKVDRSKLPPGRYRQVGFESRQVFDIDISRVVTEYTGFRYSKMIKALGLSPLSPKVLQRRFNMGQASKRIRSICRNFNLSLITEYKIILPISFIYRSVKGRFSILTKRPSGFWLTFKTGSKMSWPLQILHMRMKRASISVAKGIGCIAYPIVAGHYIIPMKKEEQTP